MSVRSVIREIINERAITGGITSPALIESLIKDNHPELFADYSIELAAKGIRMTAREMLTNSAREKQQAFEGMDLPKWFTVPDGDGGYGFVPLVAATLKDAAANLKIKQENAAAATAEVRVLSDQYRMLRTVAEDGDLILDAVAALQ
jgi:hypothetical protein